MVYTLFCFTRDNSKMQNCYKLVLSSNYNIEQANICVKFLLCKISDAWITQDHNKQLCACFTSTSNILFFSM